MRWTSEEKQTRQKVQSKKSTCGFMSASLCLSLPFSLFFFPHLFPFLSLCFCHLLPPVFLSLSFLLSLNLCLSAFTVCISFSLSQLLLPPVSLFLQPCPFFPVYVSLSLSLCCLSLAFLFVSLPICFSFLLLLIPLPPPSPKQMIWWNQEVMLECPVLKTVKWER